MVNIISVEGEAVGGEAKRSSSGPLPGAGVSPAPSGVRSVVRPPRPGSSFLPRVRPLFGDTAT